MQESLVSWRHLIAFLVAAGVMVMAWRLSQIAPEMPPPPPRVMHIQLAPPPPPPPPPPQPPHPPEKTPLQPAPPRIAPLPQAEDRNATLPAQVSPPQPVQAIVPPPAAPPAPPSPAPQIDTASLENAYAAKVYAAVEAQKHYPMSKDARLEQPRGVVAVWLMLSRAGAILDAGIAQSHGSILDRQALQSVRAATYPPFPADAFSGEPQHRFVVQLNFIPP